METQKTHTIDAKGQKLGRVATEIARLLMSKDSVDFVKNKVAKVSVIVTNARELNLDEKKQKEKIYVHYTGHPGGKRETPLKRVLDKKGVGEVISRAVYGMLPANKLRKERLKLLTIEE